MSAAGMKLPALVGTILGAGLALLSWSQTWFELELADAAASSTGEEIAVPGSIASPALAALGLAGLALVAALAIAGPAIRVVLAGLEVILGGCVLLATGLSLGDPIAAVSPAVTDATGVSGAGPTADLVASAVPTAWPAAALVGGVLLVAAGVVVLATGTRWPASARRYRSPRLVEADAGAPAARGRAASDRAIDDWDELSRGDDPTDEPQDDGRPGASR
ncbi:Trp biosynthesis-associated membrane protein [Agromyces sp. H66]|uniref:Trp biosynthesis-associated membrane protein n=1 Tax=Agromyces sp. H66 TaxID=2529859 RepID=UPI0010A9EBFC|nr:Trp biosynthesis-associated membrane protein [Agromyces sp. H66]